MKTQLITPPVEEPVILDEAKAHLRVTHNDEDALILGLIKAAREWCENYTRRRFIYQTWKAYYQSFSDKIELPYLPIISVDAIEYIDVEGKTHVLDSSFYNNTTSLISGEILLTGTPAVSLAEIDPISVTFTCGYGSASDVPQSIKQAMLLLIGNLYEYREPIVLGASITQVPFAVECLLWPYRVVGV